MEKLERIFVEMTKNIFSRDRVIFEKKKESDKPYENSTQFQWEEINDKFALKVKDSNYFESLTTAFRKVHSYKWIQGSTDFHMSSFLEAFESELRTHGIPKTDIEIGVKAIKELQKEYGDGVKSNEQDTGTVPNLDEVRKTTTDIDPYSQETTTEVDDNRKKETMDGNNEPWFGVEPKAESGKGSKAVGNKGYVRPVKNELGAPPIPKK